LLAYDLSHVFFMKFQCKILTPVSNCPSVTAATGVVDYGLQRAAHDVGRHIESDQERSRNSRTYRERSDIQGNGAGAWNIAKHGGGSSRAHKVEAGCPEHGRCPADSAHGQEVTGHYRRSRSS